MRKTKEAALITKNQIIDKAVELFIQNGFSNTTLDEIAQQTNVTRGAIYWHFKDKLDIVNELIETQHESLSQLLSDLINEDVSSFNKIQKIVEEIVRHFFETKSFQNFIELTWFKIEYTQLSNLKTTKTELTSYFINNFSRIIKEAQDIGDIKKNIHNSDVAITITNMINGMYRLYFMLPDQVKTKEQAMRSFTSYLKLIKT
jgi:TetR/AcrR family acrAB operon transcriptional repressor